LRLTSAIDPKLARCFSIRGKATIMGDVSIKGAAVHTSGKPPHHSYDEHWLEHMVHDLYQTVADEPLPEGMLDLVTRISQSDPSPDAERARRWHAKAEEIRVAAESIGSESARHTLLRLAHDYDALAESLELLILERPRRGRNAG
jgi:hypothetical protein